MNNISLKTVCILTVVLTLGSIYGYCTYNNCNISINETEKYIFQYINEERASQNLPILGNDTSLCVAAKNWSDHLELTEKVEHGDFSGRMKALGLPNTQYAAGEIIAYFESNTWGFPTENLPAETARHFVDLWLNSTKHREIMLNPSGGYMGIGVSKLSSPYYGVEFYGVVDFKFG